MVNGKPREIIGVLPDSFRFLDQKPSLILPLRLDRAKVHLGQFSYTAVARLKPGVTLDQATADVAAADSDRASRNSRRSPASA